MTSKGSAPAAGLNTGATSEELNDRFMRKHQPWRWKMKSTPHDFVPMAISDEERKEHPVCKGACWCDACYESKSNRIHTKIARREYEKARG